MEAESPAEPAQSAATPPPMPPIGEIRRGQVTDASYLNVRTGPSTNHQVITRLKGGTQVRIMGERDGWYEIILPGGRVGFVSGDYIRVEQPGKVW